MTVEEAIKILQAMPNKQLLLLLDCPECGKAQQLATVVECVVLSNQDSKIKPPAKTRKELL